MSETITLEEKKKVLGNALDEFQKDAELLLKNIDVLRDGLEKVAVAEDEHKFDQLVNELLYSDIYTHISIF